MEWEETNKTKKELQQLKEVIRLKDDLLSTIAHELRTSLSLMQRPIKKLENRTDDRATINELKKRIARLKQVTDQLNEVSHIEVDDSKLTVTEVELCTLLRQFIAIFESTAQQKDISLQISLPEHEVVQTLDLQKFEKTLFIFLSNALKFTPKGGSVDLSLAEADDNLKITVTDNGQGIAKDVLNTILNHNAPEKNKGIRLSIAKKYTSLHEGQLAIHSKKGEGTTVELTYPKEAESLEQANELGMTARDFNLISLEEHDIKDLPPLYDGDDQHSKATVLVVEDNSDMRKYMVSLLKRVGVATEVAANGLEAQKMLSIIEPDLIISDIMMPEMDGFEFVEKVRSNSKFHLIPIILISAKADEEARIHGYQIGISDYLVKPFSESELKARVLNLLRQRKERERYLKPSEPQSISYEESLIDKLKGFIHDHIENETITIKELSYSVNMSRRQLYRDLKKLTGFTPAEFVREVKLRKARELLEINQRATVAEVAHNIGYSTAAHFSKIFKNRFGQSPSEYK